MRREDRTVETSAQPVERFAETRSAPEHCPCDAVDLRRTDTLEWPTELDERAPLINDAPVCFDHDGADLQDAMTSIRQTGGLDIDDSEMGEWHAFHPRQTRSQGWRSSAILVAPGLRARVTDQEASERSPVCWAKRLRTPIGAATV